jgi:diguanylate cyclase (GGDEF)-like protein
MPTNTYAGATKTSPRSTRRLIVPIFGVVVCFVAICIYVLFDARRATMERAGEAATRVVTAVEGDFVRNLETLDLSLQAVADNWGSLQQQNYSEDLQRRILFDRSATARHLGAMLILDENGNLLMDSRELNAQPVNLADRDYFKAQKDNTSAGLYIGMQHVSRLTGTRFVGVSRRISHADGSFAGVVVASLRMSYFESLLKDMTLGPNGHILVLRTDGTILMRWPYKAQFVGANLNNTQLLSRVAQSRIGQFESEAKTDGIHRLVVYSQIGDHPLIVCVGQSMADIFAQWNRYAAVIALLIAALCGMSFFLTMHLLGELRLRNESEAALAALATTDALTGLSNRRHFDEVLGREWRRAVRSQSPIALLMIDIDLFKVFNDEQGHQIGDLMLSCMGEAIVAAVKRVGDVGARYGGDEFAIILPGSLADGALVVAQDVRTRFAALANRRDLSNPGLSIGVACIVPGLHETCDDLIAESDRALYRAKALGRNRTEVSADAGSGPVEVRAPSIVTAM